MIQLFCSLYGFVIEKRFLRIFVLGALLMLLNANGWGQTVIPIAEEDFPSVFEDTILGGDVSINDTQAEGTNTWTLINNVTYGSLNFNSDGSFTYTPNPNFNGSDNFIYQLCDGDVVPDCDNGTVTITVTAVNDMPFFSVGGNQVVTEDAGVQTIADFVTDIADGDPEVVQALMFNVTNDNNDIFSVQPAIGSDGTLTFTPSAPGTSIVTVTLTDDGTAGGSGRTTSERTFTIGVTDNTAPVITEGEISEVTCSEDEVPLPFSLTLNATDAENDDLTWEVTTPATGGTASVPGTGSSQTVSYTPNANYYGPDSFAVTVSDGNGGMDEITVNVTVSPVADTPYVTNTTINEDTQTTAGLVVTRNVNDGAEVTHYKITNIQNGILYQANGTTSIAANTFISAIQGTSGLRFTPSPNSTVSGSFDITASIGNSDAGLGGSTIIATITVNKVNDAPQNIVPVAQTIAEGGTLVFSALNNNEISVSDVDVAESVNGTLQIELSVTNGLLTLSQVTGLNFAPGDGTADATMTITGLPSDLNAALSGMQFVGYPENFYGEALLTIRTSDLAHTGSGGTKVDQDIVSVTVTDVNDAPIVNNAISDKEYDEYFNSATIDLANVFLDPENDILTLSASSSNISVVTVSVTGTTLTINEVGIGSAIITVTADDGNLTSNDNFNLSVNDMLTLPAGWDINIHDFTYSGQVTAKVFIDGTAVESGFLAAFVDDECRGIVQPAYFKPSDHYVFSLMCHSDTATGEVLTFRYYDSVKDTVYYMDRSVDFLSDMIVADAISPLIMNVGIDFTIFFPGGWKWFSVNTALDNMSLSNLMPSCATNGDYIKNQSVSATYYSGLGWFGALTVIEPKKLYKIKTVNNCSLSLSGRAIDVSSNTINVVTGWNWIGYLPQNPMPVDEALNTLNLVQLDYIKSQNISARFYNATGWWGALDTLSPSEGYMIYVTNPGTLSYPGSKSADYSKTSTELNETGFSSEEFEYNGTITSRVFIDGVLSGSEEDKLYAYVNDTIRGFISGFYFKPQDAFLYPLMIHSNLAGGETVRFRYYDAERNKIFNCKETIIFKSDMIVADAMKAFDLHISTNSINGINDLYSDPGFKAYPNPFEQVLNLEYDVSEPSDVRLSIMDQNGKIIKILVDQKHSSGHYVVRWIIDSEPGGIYFIKLQAGDKTGIRKVVLSR